MAKLLPSDSKSRKPAHIPVLARMRNRVSLRRVRHEGAVLQPPALSACWQECPLHELARLRWTMSGFGHMSHNSGLSQPAPGRPGLPAKAKLRFIKRMVVQATLGVSKLCNPPGLVQVFFCSAIGQVGCSKQPQKAQSEAETSKLLLLPMSELWPCVLAQGGPGLRLHLRLAFLNDCALGLARHSQEPELCACSPCVISEHL